MSTSRYEYRSDFMRNLVGRAKAEGEAHAVLTSLDPRGVAGAR